MGSVTLGIDLGTRQDYTAVCVTERSEDRFIVRSIQRLPLGLSYPAIGERIAEIHAGVLTRRREAILRAKTADKGSFGEGLPSLADLSRRAHETVWMLADCTGVGRPVVDALRLLPGLAGASICGVTITAGDGCAVDVNEPEGTVSKSYLISRTQVLAQQGRIRLPRTAEARALVDELLAFEIRITDDAHMVSGARTGKHDDLVIALALSVLVEPVRHHVGSFRYC